MRRRYVAVATVVVSLVAVLGALFVTWFLRPSQPEPFTTGPVLVLGGDPERADFAADLVPEPSADRPLWLSHPSASRLTDLGRHCDEDHVTCIYPEPVSTWGEAQAAATLADEEGWGQLTVVTSAFHRQRSLSLFDRCLDVPVTVTGPPPPGDRPSVPWRRAVREATATLASAVRYRNC